MQMETCQKTKGKQRSQLRGHLSCTLWQLVHVEVKGDVALQAEEAVVASLLKDGLCFEFSRSAEKHQQVPIQKPGSTGHQSWWTLAYFQKAEVHIYQPHQRPPRSNNCVRIVHDPPGWWHILSGIDVTSTESHHLKSNGCTETTDNSYPHQMMTDLQ